MPVSADSSRLYDSIVTNPENARGGEKVKMKQEGIIAIVAGVEEDIIARERGNLIARLGQVIVASKRVDKKTLRIVYKCTAALITAKDYNYQSYFGLQLFIRFNQIDVRASTKELAKSRQIIYLDYTNLAELLAGYECIKPVAPANQLTTLADDSSTSTKELATQTEDTATSSETQPVDSSSDPTKDEELQLRYYICVDIWTSANYTTDGIAKLYKIFALSTARIDQLLGEGPIYYVRLVYSRVYVTGCNFFADNSFSDQDKSLKAYRKQFTSGKPTTIYYLLLETDLPDFVEEVNNRLSFQIHQNPISQQWARGLVNIQKGIGLEVV